jgi:ParB-like chromosome segregation protein Spo0J
MLKLNLRSRPDRWLLLSAATMSSIAKQLLSRMDSLEPAASKAGAKSKPRKSAAARKPAKARSALSIAQAELRERERLGAANTIKLMTYRSQARPGGKLKIKAKTTGKRRK